MASRLAVLGVTALLIAVSVVVLALGASPAVAGTHFAPRTAVHPDATISVTPTDFQGNDEFDFEPGQSGRVYFDVNDPGLDAAVIVHINDLNATRDGLTNPVASWTVDAASGTYSSYITGLEYTLPTTLVYGGPWNVTANGTVGGFESTPFTVTTYQVGLSTPQVLLPGQSGTVTFYVVGYASGLPYTQITSFNLTAIYYDGTTASYQSLALSPSSFGAGVTTGTATFTLPLNASWEGDIGISTWANVTSAGSFSEHSTQDVGIAVFEYAEVSFNYVGVDDFVQANTPVTVTVTPWMYSYENGDQRAPDLPISFNFQVAGKNVSNSAIPGDPPTTVNSGPNGYASILFLASPSVFSTTAVNLVNTTVLAEPAGSGLPAVYYNVTDEFWVATNGSSNANIAVAFNEFIYYGGEAGSATWSVSAIGGGVASGWSGFAYALSTYSYDTVTAVVATGLLTGSSGTISFTAPSGFTGELELEVVAHNQTLNAFAEAYSDIAPSALFLTPSETAYNPGDTIQIAVQTDGPSFTGATLYESVQAYDDQGGVLASGVVTGDSFSFTVPKVGTPTELFVEVWAQSPALGTFASNYIYLDQSAGITLSAGISTVSKYSDGSFQPGQTLTVTWSLASYGAGMLASQYYVYLWTANGWYGDAAPVAWVETAATSGSFQYTVPSGAPAGTQSLFVSVDAVGACQDSCYSAGQVAYQVNPSPSALNMELGAGSGLTVGWLILLVIIIVVALLIVLVMRRGRTPKSPPSTYTATTGSMGPPAPAPSTPPATEWKEGSGAPAASDAPPSLPTPPPGAQ